MQQQARNMCNTFTSPFWFKIRNKRHRKQSDLDKLGNSYKQIRSFLHFSTGVQQTLDRPGLLSAAMPRSYYSHVRAEGKGCATLITVLPETLPRTSVPTSKETAGEALKARRGKAVQPRLIYTS